MTAVVTQDDLRRLRALARQWREEDRDWTAVRDLTELLDEIETRREAGGDMLGATVRGDSVSELKAAALLKAAELWGPDADLAIESVGSVGTALGSRGRFIATVYVRCLNYAEMTP